MLQPPYSHALNLTTQSILTFASGGISLLLFITAAIKSSRQKTPFHVLLVVAGGLAALAEPLYDLGFKLLFYVPGQWTLFTYAGIPQPVWTVTGYIALYCGPALFICERLARGIDERTFWLWTSITFLMSAAFEIVGIAGGAYEYWGPHTFRILGYPLVVAVLETTFVMCFSVLATAWRNSVPAGWRLAGLLILFPGTFYAVNFGIGSPVLVTIGLAPPSPLLVTLGTCISLAAALATLATLAGHAARGTVSVGAVRASASPIETAGPLRPRPS